MENLSSINRTASGMSGSASFVGQNREIYQQQLTATGASFSNCVSTWPQPYTYYYYYPIYQPAPPKPSAVELIALYKKEFGKEWKKMFAATVRIDAH